MPAPVAETAGANAPSEILPQVAQNGTESLNWKQFTPNTTSKIYREIVAGPDKNMWFTDDNAGKLVRMGMTGAVKEFLLTFIKNGAHGFAPDSLIVGSNGKFYVTSYSTVDPVTGGGLVGVATTTGGFGVIPTPSLDVPGNNNGVGLGPDGNVYFAERAHLGKITTAGVITEFAYPSGETMNTNSNPVAGPDGNIWFTEYFKHKIAHFNPMTHLITEIDVTNTCSELQGMTPGAGADKNMYFMCASNLLGKVTTGGTVSTFANTHGSAFTPEDIITRPDGHIWFPTANQNELGDFNPSTHVFTYHAAPLKTGLIIDIANGPDGNIWGTEGSIHVDVYILATLRPTPTKLTFAAVGQMQMITVSYGGNGKLSAVSANPVVATVAPGMAANTFVVTSKGAGKTTVTIKDDIGNSFVVSITVT
jgi:streptogramin lyase